MAKLSQLFDLIKTETVEDTDVIAAVRSIEDSAEDVAFTADKLPGFGNREVRVPQGVIHGSDSEQTLSWQSTHFTNSLLDEVGDGIDLLDLTIASEASASQNRAGFGGVAELTFGARRDGGVQSVWHRTIPFAVNFRAGGPRVTTGTGISAEDSNSTGVATNFTLAITGMTATTGTLRIELSSIPGTDITNSTLAVTIRGLATWDDPSRAISIER